MSKTKNHNKKIIIWSSIVATIVILLSIFAYYKMNKKTISQPEKTSILSPKELNPVTKQDYLDALEKWKNQALIKAHQKDHPHTQYHKNSINRWHSTEEGDKMHALAAELFNAGELRDILGRKTITLYDIEGNEHEYKYKEGFLIDEWYLDKIHLGQSNNDVSMHKLDYLDSTKPPKPPSDLPSDLKPKYQEPLLLLNNGKFTTYQF
ncbi:hypothetical protein [Candidatus Phytoplasma pruni]|uniref:Uncharacterized protein n=1 Tax=Candidatus Phytoplasma pruni TaxID=479893 RepID=A0A851HCB9_9MOLU|nr:hypothetical protein [Candidatus Phytoplasma pruni]NWN45638.1 hypothetical protein [Candidatus Phytoplasma pruni]